MSARSPRLEPVGPASRLPFLRLSWAGAAPPGVNYANNVPDHQSLSLSHGKWRRKVASTNHCKPVTSHQSLVTSVRRTIPRLQRRRLFRLEIRLTLKQSHASIPPQDRVIIPRGPNLLGLGEAVQRPLQQRQQRMRRTPGAKLRLDAPFAEQPGVVATFVGVLQPVKNSFDFAVAIRRPPLELIRDAQPKHPQSEHVLRIGRQNVAADRFGFFRFVEVAIQFGFGDGFANPRFGDRFQFQINLIFLTWDDHNCGSLFKIICVVILSRPKDGEGSQPNVSLQNITTSTLILTCPRSSSRSKPADRNTDPQR